MKKISIYSKVYDRNYAVKFETIQELNDWKSKHELNSSWGLGERWKLDFFPNTLTSEEKNSALQTRQTIAVPAYTQHTYEKEDSGQVGFDGSPIMVNKLDENGELIILSSEEIPAVMATEYLLPAEYTITITDSDNGYFDLSKAYQDLRDLRDKYLSETDFTQLPDAPISSELRQKYKTYREYLRGLPAIYNDSNITSFVVMTFEEYQVANV